MSQYNPCSDCQTSSSSSSSSCSKKKKTRASHKKCKTNKCITCAITTDLSNKVLAKFSCSFPDAYLTFKTSSTITVTHTIPSWNHPKLNGVRTCSILTNNAFMTSECSDNNYLNLYQVILPDIPGSCGDDSTVEIFTKLLSKFGLSSLSILTYFGLTTKCYPLLSIHVQNYGLCPEDFACRIVKALNEVLCVVKKRMQ